MSSNSQLPAVVPSEQPVRLGSLTVHYGDECVTLDANAPRDEFKIASARMSELLDRMYADFAQRLGACRVR